MINKFKLLSFLFLTLFTLSMVSAGSSITIEQQPDTNHSISNIDDEEYILDFKAVIGGTTPSDPKDFAVYYYRSSTCTKTSYLDSDLSTYVGEFYSTTSWSSGELISIDFASLDYDGDYSQTNTDDGDDNPYTCFLFKARWRTQVNSEISKIFAIKVFEKSQTLFGRLQEKIPAPGMNIAIFAIITLVIFNRIKYSKVNFYS